MFERHVSDLMAHLFFGKSCTLAATFLNKNEMLRTLPLQEDIDIALDLMKGFNIPISSHPAGVTMRSREHVALH
jgi:hypothetical protein